MRVRFTIDSDWAFEFTKYETQTQTLTWPGCLDVDDVFNEHSV